MQHSTTGQHSTDAGATESVRVLVYMSHGITQFNIEELALIRQEDMEDFSRQVTQTVDRIDNPNVIINFENVRVICSRLLGEIVLLNKLIRNRGGRLKLACVSENIRKIFNITALDREIKIYPDMNTAVKSYRLMRVLKFFGAPK
jgi:anti-anti-sigma factor